MCQHHEGNSKILCSFREGESANESVGNQQTNKKKFGFCFNWVWWRLFQFFNFVPPKQEACACHMQQDSIKYNSKNNIGCKAW